MSTADGAFIVKTRRKLTFSPVRTFLPLCLAKMSSWIPFWPKRDSDSPQEPPSQQAQPQASAPVAAAASAPVPPRPISTFEMASPTDLVTDTDADTDAGPLWSIPVTGFALGFCAGMYQSANRASLVFMAENAHRRPDTVQGWYFYNKTKVCRPCLPGKL